MDGELDGEGNETDALFVFFFSFLFFFFEFILTSIPIIQTILLYTVSWVSFVCYL